MGHDRRSSPQALLLLATLLERPQAWRHGYELSLETDLKSGTLYPILMRLGERGFLEVKSEPSSLPGRPPRRRVRLTPSGVAFASAELARAEQTPALALPERGRA
jgi:DNA-binding PadR family transcriptional regulator